MTGALIILAITIITGLLLWAFDKKKTPHHNQSDHNLSENNKNTPESDEFCCGKHAVCEKTSLTPLSTEIIYYDDEELDRFAGKAVENYSESEVEEFRDILLSMRPEEVAGWSRSLQLRNINLPLPVREELLMIAQEYRLSQQ